MENQSPDTPKGSQTLSKLTTRQAKALPYFLESASVHEICRRANISQASYYRYMANEDFGEALGVAKKELISGALGKLTNSLTKAAETLVSLLENPSPWIKMRAVERILDTVLRLKETNEIEEKLESLERIVLEKRTYK